MGVCGQYWGNTVFCNPGCGLRLCGVGPASVWELQLVERDGRCVGRRGRDVGRSRRS